MSSFQERDAQKRDSERDRLKFMAQPSSFTTSGAELGRSDMRIVAFFMLGAIVLCIRFAIFFVALAVTAWNFFLIFSGSGSFENWVFAALAAFVVLLAARK